MLIAEFVYNSSININTQKTLFYVNYKYTPTAYREPREVKDAPMANKLVRDLRKLYDKLRTDLKLVRTHITLYSNKTKIERPTLKKGDSVYLIRKNIKTKRPNSKLDFKKIRPFKIFKKLSDINYHLLLPKTIRIHPIFYIALLKPVFKRAESIDLVETNDEKEYKVERIIDY